MNDEDDVLKDPIEDDGLLPTEDVSLDEAIDEELAVDDEDDEDELGDEVGDDM